MNQLNDGMKHSFKIKDDLMTVHQNPLKDFDRAEEGIYGYLAIEYNQVVNEGGMTTGEALENFDGKVMIIK